MATYEKQYCWSILIRLFHWMFAFSILMLCVSGFYIADPWTNTAIEGSASWPMAYMRYIHFISGYVFAAAIGIRLFLYIFGNTQERIWDVLPITPRNIKNLFKTIIFYLYVTDEHDARLGHNVMAGSFYVVVILVSIFMVLSGFYMLFPEVSFWGGFSVIMSQQWARFIHHFLMWFYLMFVIIHVYLCVWNDIKEPEGLISSIFTGDKFIHK